VPLVVVLSAIREVISRARGDRFFRDFEIAENQIFSHANLAARNAIRNNILLDFQASA